MPLIHESGALDEPVGQRGLAVVNMGNDAEIPYGFHKWPLEGGLALKQIFIFYHAMQCKR